MSLYYNPHKIRNLYNPKDSKPFKISRSKIELFVECPRCFYIDQVLGVKRVPGFPFNLNSAVDHLLKQEFDTHRAKGEQHPLQTAYGIDAMPVPHEDLDKWRENFVGVQYLHAPTNLLVYGAIDDLWINSKGEYIVADYKATSKDEKIEVLDKEWQDGYKRQMEVYQWLLRQKGYTVSDTGYFVYANAIKDRQAFDKKLEFDVTLIPYKGDAAWVEPTIIKIKKQLDAKKIPKAGKGCDYCAYTTARSEVE